jgi:hypothetical protein
MANFSFTINETIPNIVVSENQETVVVQSTATTVTVSQNGVALVGTPGPTGPTGPRGPTGPQGPSGSATVPLDPVFDSIRLPYTGGSHTKMSSKFVGAVSGNDATFIDNPFVYQSNASTVKYMVQANNSQNIHSAEILVSKLPGVGADCLFQIYGEMASANLGSWSFDNGNLYYTPNNNQEGLSIQFAKTQFL